jgi:hypothetical protein
MANLRFSPGLLSSIRDFGADLAGSQAGARSTLTGAGAAPASLGGMLARNVGTMLGRDMRTPQEKLQAVMSQGMETPAQELKVLAEYAKLDPVRGIPLLQAAQKRIKTETSTKEKSERKEEGTSLIQDVLLTVDPDSFYSLNTLDTVSTLQAEYDISPSELEDIYDASMTARGISAPSATSKDVRFTSRGKVRDDETGEELFVTEAFNKDGTSEIIYRNSQGDRVVPKGRTSTISGTTGASAEEQNALNMGRDEYKENLERETLRIQKQFNIDEKEAGLWLEEVSEARTKVRELAPQLRRAYEQRDILDRITTGGIVPASYKAVLKFLGVEAEGVINAERFNKLAKEQMIGRLSEFGSNPTEGERASAQELVSSISDLTAVNKETIEAYIRELEYSYDDYQRVLRKGATPQSVADARLAEIDAVIQRSKTGKGGLPDPSAVQDGQYYTSKEGKN